MTHRGARDGVSVLPVHPLLRPQTRFALGVPIFTARCSGELVPERVTVPGHGGCSPTTVTVSHGPQEPTQGLVPQSKDSSLLCAVWAEPAHTFATKHASSHPHSLDETTSYRLEITQDSGYADPGNTHKATHAARFLSGTSPTEHPCPRMWVTRRVLERLDHTGTSSWSSLGHEEGPFVSDRLSVACVGGSPEVSPPVRVGGPRPVPAPWAMRKEFEGILTKEPLG